ncbi:hypothetical protein AMTR_s00038p00030240 [Amborella trichopoda]|uniref:SHSP domain-containing protein n=1 Tax=Amborella trichopoda TaxID=13333 RepID=U5CWK5_AMBTC|nr:hypothetical protein AMTR_s00038p00030240 [Amborella trichopoda]
MVNIAHFENDKILSMGAYDEEYSETKYYENRVHEKVQFAPKNANVEAISIACPYGVLTMTVHTTPQVQEDQVHSFRAEHVSISVIQVSFLG